ncbi:MAG: type II toxin-antitoxin system VapB family antitoxin [Thermodesulfovibrionales bacterium]|jgi:metal-responsive CopG/Arc/MetJ family transcriptional regulator|nr:type II toxin-antitoxin system VapB family antitoxin [Thermodesulfovibrionales bacterium]
MPTNLAIDEKLLNEALKMSGLKTKKDTVNEALREFIQRRKQKDIISLFGKIEMDKSYDYKRERLRR